MYAFPYIKQALDRNNFKKKKKKVHMLYNKGIATRSNKIVLKV